MTRPFIKYDGHRTPANPYGYRVVMPSGKRVKYRLAKKRNNRWDAPPALPDVTDTIGIGRRSAYGLVIWLRGLKRL